jgi:ankyrin repeat protein
MTSSENFCFRYGDIISENLFHLLPADLQREICQMLKIHKEIKKLSPKFYENPDDVYWKGMVLTVTDEKTPEGTNHRDFYESFIYEKVMKDKMWNRALLVKLLEDEIYLKRHIDMKDMDSCTALIYAARDLDEETIKFLLDAGADINATDRYGKGALWKALFRSDNRNAKLLINAGPDINIQEHQDWTCLMFASWSGNEDCLKLLLEKGADTTLKNSSGATALSLAKTHSIRNLLSKT